MQKFDNLVRHAFQLGGAHDYAVGDSWASKAPCPSVHLVVDRLTSQACEAMLTDGSEGGVLMTRKHLVWNARDEHTRASRAT